MSTRETFPARKISLTNVRLFYPLTNLLFNSSLLYFLPVLCYVFQGLQRQAAQCKPVEFAGFIMMSNYYLKMLTRHFLLKWQNYLN